MIAAIALFVAAPLTDHDTIGGTSATDEQSGHREHEHALTVQALRELEFDYAMGKLDANDYRMLRGRLETRALAAMAGWEKRPGPPRPELAATRQASLPAARAAL